MICNDNRFDSLLIYYSDIKRTIRLPDDIIQQKPYLLRTICDKNFPDNIGKFNNLRELYITSGPVKNIPEQIVNCQKLQSMLIENFGLKGFL